MTDFDPNKFQEIDLRQVREWERFQAELRRARLWRGVKAACAILAVVALAIAMMLFLSARICP